MRCVKCNYPHTRLVKIVQSEDKYYTTRRRECVKCGARFTTEENLKETKQFPDHSSKGDRS